MRPEPVGFDNGMDVSTSPLRWLGIVVSHVEQVSSLDSFVFRWVC